MPDSKSARCCIQTGRPSKHHSLDWGHKQAPQAQRQTPEPRDPHEQEARQAANKAGHRAHFARAEHSTLVGLGGKGQVVDAVARERELPWQLRSYKQVPKHIAEAEVELDSSRYFAEDSADQTEAENSQLGTNPKGKHLDFGAVRTDSKIATHENKVGMHYQVEKPTYRHRDPKIK